MRTKYYVVSQKTKTHTPLYLNNNYLFKKLNRNVLLFKFKCDAEDEIKFIKNDFPNMRLCIETASVKVG